jgi:hypothetical protein
VNQAFKNRLLTLLKHPWVVPGFLLVEICEVWTKIDGKRMTKRSDEKFTADVREHLSFLFTDHGAQLVPNERETPPYFDWAQATVATDDLRFNFTRDHGIIFANVAPKRAPNESQNLSAVLTAMANVDGTDREVEFARLPTIAVRLKSEMGLLKDALSERNFEKTKELVSNICKRRDIQARLQLESELSERRKYLGLS